MKEKPPRFGAILAEAVQEGLNSIGPSISDAVLFYVQKKAGVQPDQCDLDPEIYDDCFRAIFGWGAEIVEKKILECLYLKLEVRLKIKSRFVFIDEVKKAQKLLDSSDMPISGSSGGLEGEGMPTRKALAASSR